MDSKIDKRISKELAKVCEMLSTYKKITKSEKKQFLKYARAFRMLGNIGKTKSMEVKQMSKKLTDKEKDDREVKRIIFKIKKLEKTHPQELVERACSRYKMANVDKRKAEKSIEELEKNLADAKRRLK